MPELPEVETTRRGIAPHLQGQRVSTVVIRDPRLRWPVSPALARELPGQRIEAVERRAKYLLLRTQGHALILHLGMSGRLCIAPASATVRPHDHLDVALESGLVLRLNDPRRFGAALWWAGDPLSHPLLRQLGPEPLSDAFTGTGLHQQSRRRRAPVKAFIMDSRVVVGVGNIYANEALFLAGIHPLRAAGRIGLGRYERLVAAIKTVLNDAIGRGGTTLRDYVSADGSPGYFQLDLSVYARTGQPCPRCAAPVRRAVAGQRGTFYCPRCQH